MGRFTKTCDAVSRSGVYYRIRVMINTDAMELASMINRPSARFLFIRSISTQQF